MALSLEEIKNPIKEELKEFEQIFSSSMRSSVPLLNTIMGYIVKRKGKQMRPMFVLLAAQCFGKVNERTYRGASLVELLHTATLVHDDVVDDSHKRRGFFSINALWKNKIAVLVGDYLLSQGLLLSIDNDDFDLLKLVSTAVREMSEGELLQIEKARKLDITEEVYYDIITKKTASLIASCCAIGAATTSNDKEAIERMRLFGEKVGVAFQMKDDLFDYGKRKIGKPTGIDIKEKKMTLPLIYTLNNCSSADKKHIINSVKNHSGEKERVNEIIEMVKSHGGIDYTIKEMNRVLQEAYVLLEEMGIDKTNPELKALVQYVIDREV
jgi:octaprenyl-diphosphate synthase